MHEREAPRATVLALHGFSMGQPRIDAFALFAAQWFRRGLDVALLTLPYHGARTPTRRAFLRRALRRSRSRGVQRGACGAPSTTSTSCAAGCASRPACRSACSASASADISPHSWRGLCDDLDFVVPMVPPVCIGDLAWRFFARSQRRRARRSAPAYSRDELRAMYRVHSPLTFALRVPKERVLIIAGRGDRIVPPEHPHALWRHWGEPRIHWFSGSHLAPFGRERIIAAAADHLTRLGIL